MRTLPLLLEPENLLEFLNQQSNATHFIIIEQASQQDYNDGHIPGSYWLDFKQLQSTLSFPGMLPTAQQLSAVFSELGITADTHIICSDGEGGGWAGRLIWILDCLGHKHYSFLNGGLNAWRQAGLPCEQNLPIKQKSQYQAKVFDEPYTATKEQILASLSDNSLIIWDARSEDEYNGKKSNSARAGHIPNAIHYEWTRALDPSKGLRIRDLDQLAVELSEIGISQRQEIITYCQSHHRSGFTYLLGKLLNLKVKGYAGSWSEWGNAPDTPISTVN